jgi:methylase of polypeptide subunit release factors
MARAASIQREIDPSTRITCQRDASRLDLRQRSGRLLDRAVHFLSHRFILSRRRTTITRAAGLRLAVPPTVFHPRYFLTSEFLAAFIDGLDLADKRVADIGTGTGILALAAARSGAASVLAIDINPRAALAAAENARANGLASRVRPVCSDLFAGILPGAHFDVILSNPPFFVGEPLDLADRAWHAGPDYRDIAPLFDQARARLAPGGSMYVVLSSHADHAGRIPGAPGGRAFDSHRDAENLRASTRRIFPCGRCGSASGSKQGLLVLAVVDVSAGQ